MEITISIKGGNPAKVFADLEQILKSSVYKFELKTDNKTITSEGI